MRNVFLGRLFFFTLIVQAVVASVGFAQSSHKGISFQGLIKLPSGEYPTRSNLTVNAKILSSNNCILREEEFTNVTMADGNLNLVVGTGAAVGEDAGLSLPQIMNNSAIIDKGPSKPTGLTCLREDGTVDSGLTSFDPTTTNGARRLRLSFSVDSTPVSVDFTMRSVAYAINSETLNGKTEANFINTSNKITQSAVEDWFASLMNGVVPVSKLGTGNANSSTYLRGDGQWATITGGSGAVDSVNGKTGTVTLATTDLADFGTATDNRITSQITSVKGAANGLASLDGAGKIPAGQLNLGSLASKSSVDLATGEASGILPLSKGGTGASDQAGAANNILPSQSSQAGKVLTTNGSVVSWGAIANELPAAAGTAAAPGYAFSGNTNTGMFGAATNQIALSTNGSERLRIDALGNVGIGTESPGVSLDVAGAMRAGNSASVTACGMGQGNGEGSQRYNYSTHNMEYCNGTAWVALSTYSGPTTQNNVTASRASGTVYQNTSGKPMFVTVVAAVNTGFSVAAYSDSSTAPTQQVAANTGANNGAARILSFIVLPNNYYKVLNVDSPGSALIFSSWVEWY